MSVGDNSFPVDVATHFTGVCVGPTAQVEVKQSASKTTGVFASARNTKPYPLMLYGAVIHIRTESTGACGIDVGGAATNIDNAAVFSGKSVASTPADTFYRTEIATPIKIPVGGYLTAAVASGDLNGADLVIGWYCEPTV